MNSPLEMGTMTPCPNHVGPPAGRSRGQIGGGNLDDLDVVLFDFRPYLQIVGGHDHVDPGIGAGCVPDCKFL